MITKNDETGLAAIDDDQEMREWCRVAKRAVVCIRIRVPIATVVRWKNGDTVWVWEESIDKQGHLHSRVYGHITAFCFEQVNRINDRGEYEHNRLRRVSGIEGSAVPR